MPDERLRAIEPRSWFATMREEKAYREGWADGVATVAAKVMPLLISPPVIHLTITPQRFEEMEEELKRRIE